MSSKIIIPDEMKVRYIERRKKDLVDCRQALSKHDFECISGVGHQIKGNAATFGFGELTPMAIEMEKLAATKDLTNLAEVLNRFEAYLNGY